VVYIRFALSALAVIASGLVIARAGDVIAVRSGLGRFLFGTILLGASTSLPEVATGFNAIRLGVPDLAVGNNLGSCLTNMLLLGIFDLFSRRGRLLHRIAINHSLTAALATLLIGSATFFIVVPLDLQLATLDAEGLFLIGLFVGGVWLIQRRARIGLRAPEAEPGSRMSLPVAIVVYVAAAALLLVAAPVLVDSAEAIALQTGLGAGLIGIVLLSLVTSMPELVSSFVAVRIGAFDLAVGNLFGSTVFSIFVIGLLSQFFPGLLLSAVSPGFIAVGLLALLLVNWALLGTLANLEWRPLGIEWDAAIIIIVYLAGIYLLYRQGLLQAVR
jgi:cation:H+ antiporter